MARKNHKLRSRLFRSVLIDGALKGLLLALLTSSAYLLYIISLGLLATGLQTFTIAFVAWIGAVIGILPALLFGAISGATIVLIFNISKPTHARESVLIGWLTPIFLLLLTIIIWLLSSGLPLAQSLGVVLGLLIYYAPPVVIFIFAGGWFAKDFYNSYYQISRPNSHRGLLGWLFLPQIILIFAAFSSRVFLHSSWPEKVGIHHALVNI